MLVNVTANLPTILNEGSVGRLLSDEITKRLWVTVVIILALYWTSIWNIPGLVMFCVMHGFFSGTSVSLRSPKVAGLCPGLNIVGMCIDTVLTSSEIGLSTSSSSPVIGAIFRNEGG